MWTKMHSGAPTRLAATVRDTGVSAVRQLTPKAFAWTNSYYRDGVAPGTPVEVSPEVPDGWTFELYGPPTEPRPKVLAIGPHEIFPRVRLKIPDVTVEEIEEAIMQSVPYMGGPRH
jgi:hypothetical protein